MTSITQTPRQPSVPKSSYLDDLPDRKIGWLERMLGPESYRILKGVISNPLSVAGISLITLFIVVALTAPLIIPSASTR